MGWATVFLLVQQLEKATGYDTRLMFHKELGQLPTIIPERAPSWPAELKPAWRATR